MVIIHCFLNNFVINVDIEPSSRLSCLWHQITSEWRFSNVLKQNQRHENRKTSGWSKSACSVHGRYRQRYLRVRVFNNFVNNVDIEPWSRILCSRHPITSDRACFRMCWWQRSDTIIEKHLTGQKVIVPYVEDTNSDILFTIKGIEMNFAETYMEWDCIVRRDLNRVLQETLKL